MRDLPLAAGDTVLVRTDYNVPMNDKGKITDDFRITTSLPTLKYLLERGCRVVIIAALGRPDSPDPKFSLKPVAKHLSKLLDRPVKFADDCVGDRAKVATKHLRNGEIVMLENLRFHPGEEADDREFAKQLARDSHAKYFVQDAFGMTHRAHASMVAITEFLPSVAGFLLESEYLAIKNATDNPNRPLVAILGGAKIADKIELIKHFIDIADQVIVGGAMANDFLKYLKFPIGASVYEPGLDDTIADILKHARKKYGPNFEQSFIIPTDVAVAETGDLNDPRVEMPRSDVGIKMKILDIGPETIVTAEELIEKAGTVIWNGTMGMAEKPAFAIGSARIAMTIAKNPQITSVIGGGDTAEFVRDWDALKGGSFTHVSTGGGASLELMAGEMLPGIAALLPT